MLVADLPPARSVRTTRRLLSVASPRTECTTRGEAGSVNGWQDTPRNLSHRPTTSAGGSAKDISISDDAATRLRETMPLDADCERVVDGARADRGHIVVTAADGQVGDHQLGSLHAEINHDTNGAPPAAPDAAHDKLSSAARRPLERPAATPGSRWRRRVGLPLAADSPGARVTAAYVGPTRHGWNPWRRSSRLTGRSRILGGRLDRDQAFADYVRRSWPSLVRSAFLLGCSAHEAEDLVQTTLIRCYTAWGNVVKATDRDAYVYRMLVNCHHDSRRRRWCSELPSASLPERSYEDDTTGVDDADVVGRALAHLNQGHREVVVLRYHAQLTETQIARILSIAPGTVKSRLSRALARLSEDLNLADFHGRSGK